MYIKSQLFQKDKKCTAKLYSYFFHANLLIGGQAMYHFECQGRRYESFTSHAEAIETLVRLGGKPHTIADGASDRFFFLPNPKKSDRVSIISVEIVETENPLPLEIFQACFQSQTAAA